MNAAAAIARKRDGGEHAPEEIRWLIELYTAGELPDYQMSAWAMAVFLRGMSAAETAALTESMLASGTTLAWSDGPAVVDKHSTGGIGDKTSLIIAPLLASCGLRVPMLSGRGLGATGGTLDKLEAIPGYRTDLSLPEITRVVDQVGCVITGASAELAPADRKLYALRDVTGTVPSIPLITASIMSKKLAEGPSALVLDVKFGSGAFMKTIKQARELARSLVATGIRMGVATTALITDMNQPLGRLAGNAVEVDESLDVLRGSGPADVRELSLALAAEVLVSARSAPTLRAARTVLEKYLVSGAAHEKFCQVVAAQGGNLDAPRPRAAAYLIESPTAGFLAGVDAEAIGYAIIELGGGRKKLGQPIDPAVGIEMLVRIGDHIERDQPLFRVFARPAKQEESRYQLLSTLTITPAATKPMPLIVERVTESL
ncbi:MAG: thymidine phosphorylase [Pirellulaceae bacterium]